MCSRHFVGALESVQPQISDEMLRFYQGTRHHPTSAASPLNAWPLLLVLLVFLPSLLHENTPHARTHARQSLLPTAPGAERKGADIRAPPQAAALSGGTATGSHGPPLPTRPLDGLLRGAGRGRRPLPPETTGRPEAAAARHRADRLQTRPFIVATRTAPELPFPVAG